VYKKEKEKQLMNDEETDKLRGSS